LGIYRQNWTSITYNLHKHYSKWIIDKYKAIKPLGKKTRRYRGKQRVFKTDTKIMIHKGRFYLVDFIKI
jgi:hypothetical protein